MTASTALITGASRGIGREVARALASEGWHVLSGVRDPKSAPPGTQPEVVDMADPESIEALAERLRARNQRLDALVNNAGVYRGPTRQIWDVNVLGPLRLTRALEPFLVRNARVVMVTSGLGHLSAQPASLVKRLSTPRLSLAELERLAEEASGDYGASKAALTAMARLFALELRAARNPRQRNRSRMVPHRHGWSERAAFSGTGGGQRPVGRAVAARRAHRWGVRRWKSDRIAGRNAPRASLH